MDAAVCAGVAEGQFILGPNVSALDAENAAFLGVRHAVGVASGTDALIIGLRAAGGGSGDEVYRFPPTPSLHGWRGC
jgi:dTDP-4-amino-4,6-dideoxygalactose transaminase